MGAIQWPIKYEGCRIFDARGAYIGIGSDGHAAELVEAANRGHEATGYECAAGWRDKFDEQVEISVGLQERVRNLEDDGLAFWRDRAYQAENERDDLRRQLYAMREENAKLANAVIAKPNPADPRLSEVLAAIPKDWCVYLYCDGSMAIRDAKEVVRKYSVFGSTILESLRNLANPDAATITTIRQALADGTDERAFFERLLAERKGGAK